MNTIALNKHNLNRVTLNSVQVGTRGKPHPQPTKKFYEEVEYIYSRAYNKYGIINTGYIPNADDITIVEGDILVSQTRTIIAASTYYRVGWNNDADNSLVLAYAQSYSTPTNTPLSFPYETITSTGIIRDPIHIIGEINKQGSKVNGVLTQSGVTRTQKLPYPLSVFAALTAPNAEGEYQKTGNICATFQLMKMQVMNKDRNILYDFIPVRLLRDLTDDEKDENTRFFYQEGCYGLYDKVSGKFFGQYFDTGSEMCILGSDYVQTLSLDDEF